MRTPPLRRRRPGGATSRRCRARRARGRAVDARGGAHPARRAPRRRSRARAPHRALRRRAPRARASCACRRPRSARLRRGAPTARWSRALRAHGARASRPSTGGSCDARLPAAPRRRLACSRRSCARSTRPASTCPAARGAYPSSVLMNAIPARVAGVPRARGGDAAAHARGEPGAWPPRSWSRASRTRSSAWAARRRSPRSPTARARVPAVAKIVGPGNAYVAAAKRQVRGARRDRPARRARARS